MKLWTTFLLMIGLSFAAFGQNLQTTVVKYSKGIPYKGCKYTVDFDLRWPVAGAPHEVIGNIQNQLLQNIIGEKALNQDIYASINNHINATIYEWKKDIDDDCQSDWQEIYKGYFLTAAHNFISYMLEVYQYFGGAHGVGNTFSINFNLKTGRRVLESDLFVANYEKTLQGIIKSNLRRAHPDLIGDITWEDVVPNDNFYITSKGITYIFNPYEIAYYALGTIKVNLPWKDLAPILKRANY